MDRLTVLTIPQAPDLADRVNRRQPQKADVKSKLIPPKDSQDRHRAEEAKPKSGALKAAPVPGHRLRCGGPSGTRGAIADFRFIPQPIAGAVSPLGAGVAPLAAGRRCV